LLLKKMVGDARGISFARMRATSAEPRDNCATNRDFAATAGQRRDD
jgi:hypothetical protein